MSFGFLSSGVRAIFKCLILTTSKKKLLKESFISGRNKIIFLEILAIFFFFNEKFSQSDWLIILSII